MFCPHCGFESNQKTNYCKRCGGSLGLTAVTEPPRLSRPNLGIIALMFCSVALFGILGLFTLFAMYGNLVMRGLRGDELLIPFMMGAMLTGGIAGLLIWQLARMISAYQKSNQNVIVEKHYIRETPPAQLGAPTDPIPQVVERPSVVEHTTRQMAIGSGKTDAPK